MTDVEALVRGQAGIRLDVGCGARKNGPDWVGLDDHAAADIRHDYRVTPWPLPDACVHTAALSHVWQYIPPDRSYAVMAELHRVCRHGADVFLVAPYADSYLFLSDPEAVAMSTERTWVYWDNRSPNWQKRQPPVFHLLSARRVPLPGSVDHQAHLRACHDPTRCDLCPTPLVVVA